MRKLHEIRGLAFKNGEPKRMRDLGDAFQRQPVAAIKVAVLNFVKEGVNPVETHCTGWAPKKKYVKAQ